MLPRKPFERIKLQRENKPKENKPSLGESKGSGKNLVDSRPKVSDERRVVEEEEEEDQGNEEQKIEKEINGERIRIIEEIEFKNGNNTLAIRFSEVNNRRFRIQVFLNETTEVRPVTYAGSSSGVAFWNLLKGSLKK